ncbi:MAG: hypothetical protein JW395_2116 [Nitrospira sp.]|nr:hypothetical protein [Nitrospira sp.]
MQSVFTISHLRLTTYEHRLSKPAFVILMSADPEPCHSITVKDAKCTIAQRDSNGPYLFFLIHTLEV